ncbi:PREDICTED: activator of 90 kDa heat shock protein ATPase homolog 1-like [Rhagoletis zephyria]|uniref:activator of 90 kDa heat shock protein ATPase homolog 1-like n=1 Tax=Rhagoletis zephyria TaxID=28612 RepID=UPI0008116F9F|nr:PREDICTED: activator of 90 kDa heat shock protein ATPase homolog 1-like [Rhagoletis zephyria]KAH9400842.1 AHA1, activator of heat shock 90kDa protein ATPase [Tyrophagus putrescentiae]
MAKWGEGDPRWIVEERPDATNVNNWHWTEKNAAHWSKEKLQTLLMGLQIDDASIGRCYISEVSSIEGEAVANNRKGKLIFFYEWVIKCNWKGNVNGQAEEISGKLEIPNLSEENSADEITVDVSLDTSGSKEDLLKNLMRSKGEKAIREQLSKYILALRDEFAKDMIKPSKLTDGGSINSFQTEAQLKKTKSEASSSSTTNHKKPATAAAATAPKQPQQPTPGVKIDTTTLTLTDTFKCSADEFYQVLTDPKLVQAFTQNKVTVEAHAGGQFSLLDGNIVGKFTHLEPGKVIKQNWRVKNWPAEHYSEVTITINQKEDATEVNISQKGVPRTDLVRTEEGWKRFYFESIKRTFGFGASMF